MKLSRKTKQIILGVVLLGVITAGIAALRLSNNQDKNVQKAEKTAVVNTDDKPFYYVEKKLYEEHSIPEHLALYFVNYKGNTAKAIETEDGMKLANMKTMKNVADVPHEVIANSTGYWIDEDSNFVTVNYNKEKKAVLVRTFDKNGKEVKEPVALKEFGGLIKNDSYINIDEFRTDSKYIYLLSVTNHFPIFQIFNKDGSLHKDYTDIGSFDIDYKGSIYTTFGVSDEHKYSGFEKIDVESGKVQYSVKTENHPNFIRYNKEKDSVYVMDYKEITRYNASNGKNGKNIFTFGKDSTYVLDSIYPRDFFVGSEEDLYIALCYFESDKYISLYYGYEPKEGTRPERAVTLTVTAPYRQDFLSDAITRYEMKYPDQKVKYDYKYNSEEEFVVNTEQYGQQLALSILGGNVGDVVMTGGSGLNYEDVFKTDAFMDLSPLIDKDKNYDILNKDVIEGLRIKGAIRGLPISISRSYYEVNTKLLDSMGVKLDYNNLTWKDVISLTKVIEEKAPDSHLFTGNEYVGDYLIPMIVVNIPQLVDFENKKINLDQEWFVDLLKDLKAAMKSEKFVVAYSGSSNIIDSLEGSLFVRRSTERTSYRDMVGRYLMYNEDEGKESLYIPIFVGEKSSNRSVHANNMYSINNKSKNKEDAWKFLSFLLEDDIQKLRTLRSEPINTRANREILEATAEEFSRNYGDDALKVVDMMMNIFDCTDYVDMYYNKQDIYNPLISYINDEMPLEEALKKAEENVWIRLNE